MGGFNPVSPGWDQDSEVRAWASRNQSFSTRGQNLSFSSRAERYRLIGAQQVEHRLALSDLLAALAPAPSELKLSLRQILEQNPKKTLKDALDETDPSLRPSLTETLGSEALNQLLSISQDGDREIFLNEVLDWAGRLENSGKLSAAAFTYQFVAQHAQNAGEKLGPDASRIFAELQGRAEQNLAVLKGGGPASLHLEFIGKRILDQTLDPAMFLGFGVGGVFFKGMRLKVLSELLAIPEAGIWTRGLVPTLLASGAGLAVEAPSFVLTVKAGHTMMGLPENWSASSVSRDILGNGLTLLSMHATSALGAKAFQSLRGVDTILGQSERVSLLTRTAERLMPQTAMLGGILLSHKAEELFRLRPQAEGSHPILDGLATLIQFNLAGPLAQRFLGKNFAAWERLLELQAEHISRKTPELSSISWAEKSSSKAGEARPSALSKFFGKNLPDFFKGIPAGFGGPMMIFSSLLMNGKDLRAATREEFSTALERYNQALRDFDEAFRLKQAGHVLTPDLESLLSKPEMLELRQARERFVRANEHFIMEEPTEIVALQLSSSIETSDLHIGQIIDGSYRIEAVLGAGGMGVVYRCKHVVLGKDFAMKVLKPEHSANREAIERFEIEAKAASQIRNPHIIDINHASRLPNGDAYIVMEYLDGISLEKILDGNPMPVTSILQVAQQLTEGLSAAHRSGIVHRDLKPDNIFLVTHGAEQDFVKILDFGIAKIWSHSGQKITQEGLTIGTPEYMSPEQAVGSANDHRSDIYSLGVILYEMASGQLPFNSGDKSAILRMHLAQDPPRFRDLEPPRTEVHPGLEAIILKALAKQPEDRYQSMEELKLALLKLKGEINLPSPGRRAAPRTEFVLPIQDGGGRKGRWALFGGVLAAGLSTLLAIALATRESEQVEGTKQVPLDAPRPDAATRPVITPIMPDAAVPVPKKKIEILVEPKDAHVFQDERDMGANRAILELEENSTVEIEIRRKGFKTKKVKVDASQEKITLRLEREKSNGNNNPVQVPKNPDKNPKDPEKPDFVLDPFKKKQRSGQNSGSGSNSQKRP